MIEIDARGLSCPEPVIRTKKALANSPKEIQVLVDNNVAKENVTRLLESGGYTINIKEEQEDIVINAKK
ncbi:MAG: sulfurtransferase TusA family protein [Peptostreptococcaceae bacterium]|nr:sulfurtransferase TusA family protein [Peptostreptococcaceae bacterium]